MTYPHDLYERNRQVDHAAAQYEAAAGMMPFLAVLCLIVAGLVIYQFAFSDSTTQTATNMPSTMEKVAPPVAMPRAPAETTGSGAVR